MPVIFNWDGSQMQPSSPNKERTNKGGVFIGSKNKPTYFPLASTYSSLLPTTGYYVVPPKYADRPDLIANELYQSTDYWWVILWSNDIIDPFGRPSAGETIRIIDIITLENLLGK